MCTRLFLSALFLVGLFFSADASTPYLRGSRKIAPAPERHVLPPSIDATPPPSPSFAEAAIESDGELDPLLSAIKKMSAAFKDATGAVKERGEDSPARFKSALERAGKTAGDAGEILSARIKEGRQKFRDRFAKHARGFLDKYLPLPTKTGDSKSS